MASSPVVGIDLGTTFSVVAYLDSAGRPSTVNNAEGDPTTPSLVYLEPEGAIVGKEAVKAGELEPDLLARHPKRAMGSERFPQKVRGESWPPEVLQALILRKLKQDAELQLGPLSKAVITVPAYFNEPRRKATQDAGRMAGWDVIDILNEPTAAAISYGVKAGFVNSDAASKPETVLVYDLGGGTFDVTLMRVEQNRFTVLATAGDVELGGIDWDNRIVDLVAEESIRVHKADPRQDPVALTRLRGEAESAKRALTARPSVQVAFAWNQIKLRLAISREQFEEKTGDLVDRTRFTVRRLMKDGKVEFKDLTRLLVVGGSTRMPMIGAMLEQETGRPVDRSLSPDEAVAHGAAIYAQTLAGDAKSTKLKITNVNAHDLGILGQQPGTTLRKRFVMIPRNTPLPAERSQVFPTGAGKTNAIVPIVEGGDASGNGATPIGKCSVPLQRKAGAERPPVTVKFHYQENGRLDVSASSPNEDPVVLMIDRGAGMPEESLAQWTQRVAAGLVPTKPKAAPTPASADVVEEVNEFEETIESDEDYSILLEEADPSEIAVEEDGEEEEEEKGPNPFDFGG